jgi:hypothetical protein
MFCDAPMRNLALGAEALACGGGRSGFGICNRDGDGMMV